MHHQSAILPLHVYWEVSWRERFRIQDSRFPDEGEETTPVTKPEGEARKVEEKMMHPFIRDLQRPKTHYLLIERQQRNYESSQLRIFQIS